MDVINKISSENFIKSISEITLITDSMFSIVYANDPAFEEFGESVIGKKVNDIMQFHNMHTLREIADSESSNYSFEDIIRNKSGYEYRVNVRVHRFENEGIFYYSWFFIDYSEELEAKQQMIDFMAELNHAKGKILAYSNEIEIFKNIINTGHQGIVISDASGQITFSNPAADSIFNVQLKNSNIDYIKRSFSHSGDFPIEKLSDYAGLGTVKGEVLIFDEKGQRERKCYITVFPVESKSVENETFLVWEFLELTQELEMQQKFIDFSAELAQMNRELNTKNEEILKLSRTDSLTQLYNRRYIMELFAKKLSENKSSKLSVMLFDIDNFKQVNDNLGHQAGDAVLQNLASIAWEVIGERGILGRYGGEEFIAVLPDADSDAGLEAANELLETVRNIPCNFGKQTIEVTITVGMTQFMAGDTIDTMIQRADIALYLGKRKGKNRVHFDS